MSSQGEDRYAYYAEASARHALEHGEIYLAYGVLDSPDVGTREVGHHLMRALRTAGLEPEWDQDPRTMIRVPLVWRRR